MEGEEEYLVEEDFTYSVEPVEMESITTPETEKRVVWTDAATKFLLHNVKEKMDNVGKTVALKNKTKMWKTIAGEMASFGTSFSPAQVESKFRSLERQYKRALLNNKSTGRSRYAVPFQNELDEILGKKKGVNPSYVLGVGPEELESRSSTSSPVFERETPKKRRTSTSDKFLDRLNVMCDELKGQHEEMMEFLKENQKKKEENEKKKEARAEQKDEILKKILEKM